MPEHVECVCAHTSERVHDERMRVRVCVHTYRRVYVYVCVGPVSDSGGHACSRLPALFFLSAQPPRSGVCFLPEVKSDRDRTRDSRHSHFSSKPSCLQNAEAGEGRGWPIFCFQNGRDSERVGSGTFMLTHTGGRRTIQSENSMQIC